MFSGVTAPFESTSLIIPWCRHTSVVASSRKPSGTAVMMSPCMLQSRFARAEVDSARGTGQGDRGTGEGAGGNGGGSARASGLRRLAWAGRAGDLLRALAGARPRWSGNGQRVGGGRSRKAGHVKRGRIPGNRWNVRLTAESPALVQTPRQSTRSASAPFTPRHPLTRHSPSPPRTAPSPSRSTRPSASRPPTRAGSSARPCSLSGRRRER